MQNASSRNSVPMTILWNHGSVVQKATPHAGTLVYLPPQAMLGFCRNADDAHALMRRAQDQAVRQKESSAVSLGAGRYMYVLSIEPCMQGEVWTTYDTIDVRSWCLEHGLPLCPST